MKKNPLGIPWWLWVGGGAAILYLTTRKAAAAMPNIYTPPPKQPVPQVVDPEDPPVGEYSQMSGCAGCL